MVAGVIGLKIGMTRIFKEDGLSIPVSVIQVLPHRVTQIKTPLHDGYSAIQVTTGSARAKNLTKALDGHYKKAGVEAGLGLWEFSLSETEANQYTVGAEITVNVFNEGQFVDVTGITKGRGFSGVIRRHNFSSQRASHGNSLSHNAPGSIGQNQSPGRVFPGKRMAGQYGNTQVTAQGLEVIRVDAEKNLILIKGAIPGAPGGRVTIMPSVKDKKKTA